MPSTVIESDKRTKYSFADLDNFLKTECPDDYAALPPSTNYRFVDWSYATNSNSIYNPIVNVLLHVGTNLSGSEIHAYLTHNGVALNSGHVGVKLESPKTLTIDSLKKPFSYLGNRSIDMGKFKALVYYTFLSAGHVSEVSLLSDLKTDLRRACAWIQNKGSKPLPITEKRKRKFQAVHAQERESMNVRSWGQLASPPSTDAATLAGRDLALQRMFYALISNRRITQLTYTQRLQNEQSSTMQ